MTRAITSTGLSKSFGGQTAVHDVDLDVPAGSVYGFLGPNGSGKTTTIRMLLGLVYPSSGSRTVLGVDIARTGTAVLARVGALVEGPAFHPYLSGTANLARLDAASRFAEPATSRARVGQALERVGLSAAASKKYRHYSLGMRQRLGIAATLLQSPDLLILDEPTNGLDPQGTREVRHLISALGRDGVTVFVSSHQLSEVEQVCSHVGMMSAGAMVWQGPLAELGAQQHVRVQVRTTAAELASDVLIGLGLSDVLTSENGASGVLGSVPAEAVVAALVGAGVGVSGFVVARPTLEDIFVALTGEGFDVSA